MGVPYLGFQGLCPLFYQVPATYLSLEPTKVNAKARWCGHPVRPRSQGARLPPVPISPRLTAHRQGPEKYHLCPERSWLAWELPPLAVCCCLSAWPPSTQRPVCISRNRAVPSGQLVCGQGSRCLQVPRKPVELCWSAAMPGRSTAQLRARLSHSVSWATMPWALPHQERGRRGQRQTCLLPAWRSSWSPPGSSKLLDRRCEEVPRRG